jgi:palmitoyltransferase ZDHHC9/14/18
MGRAVSMAIFAASCVLPALSVAWLATTACRDPGILPRQEPDDEWLAGRKPRTKDVAVNGHRVQVRYNDTCHFYQPPRAHHCSVNDNCIERFDHHCPWVGTTIGRVRGCVYCFGVCGGFFLFGGGGGAASSIH